MTTTKANRTRTARDQLANYNEDHLMCRIQRHHFDLLGVYNYTDPYKRKHKVAEAECANCGTVRKTFMNTKYEREFAYYDYPDGFRFEYAPSEGRVTSGEQYRDWETDRKSVV